MWWNTEPLKFCFFSFLAKWVTSRSLHTRSELKKKKKMFEVNATEFPPSKKATVIFFAPVSNYSEAKRLHCFFIDATERATNFIRLANFIRIFVFTCVALGVCRKNSHFRIAYLRRFAYCPLCEDPIHCNSVPTDVCV